MYLRSISLKLVFVLVTELSLVQFQIVNVTVNSKVMPTSSSDIVLNCVNSSGTSLLDHCRISKKHQSRSRQAGHSLIHVCCSLDEDVQCYLENSAHFCSHHSDQLVASLTLLSTLLAHTICGQVGFNCKSHDKICALSFNSALTLGDPVVDQCTIKGQQCMQPMTGITPNSTNTCCTMYRTMRCMFATRESSTCSSDPTNPGVPFINSWLNQYRVAYKDGICEPVYKVTNDMCPDIVPTEKQKKNGAKHQTMSSIMAIIISMIAFGSL